MRDPAAYKKALARASGRHKCYVFAFWVVAAAAASPLFYLFKNWPFPDRLSCQESHLPLTKNVTEYKWQELEIFEVTLDSQVMDEYSMIYGVASGTALYLLPWLAIIVAMLFIQGGVVEC